MPPSSVNADSKRSPAFSITRREPPFSGRVTDITRFNPIGEGGISSTFVISVAYPRPQYFGMSA